jgi:Holliday junction resolvase-like predicted endonuclease
VKFDNELVFGGFRSDDAAAFVKLQATAITVKTAKIFIFEELEYYRYNARFDVKLRF